MKVEEEVIEGTAIGTGTEVDEMKMMAVKRIEEEGMIEKKGIDIVVESEIGVIVGIDLIRRRKRIKIGRRRNIGSCIQKLDALKLCIMQSGFTDTSSNQSLFLATVTDPPPLLQPNPLVKQKKQLVAEKKNFKPRDK